MQRPIRIRTLSLPHRILMGSMHMNLEDVGDDGRALAAFYAARARAGAALIVTGGSAVNRLGAGGPGYSLVNDETHSSRLRRIVDEVHAAGGRIALQLFHAGRYALLETYRLTPIAPSAVYSNFSRCLPERMNDSQIADTIADFAAGAQSALALGFDAVEVMASEGYLLNQFASPVTNHRDDEWGGDAARRREFPTAVVAAVRGAIGDAPLIVRMSGADLVEGSSSEAETDELAAAYVSAGADAIDVGIGWHESRVPTVQTLVPHGAWVPVAARIKRSLVAADRSVPVVASNRINTLQQAQRILETGDVDLVSMARPFLADPAILDKSFQGRPEFVNTCIGCNEACIDRSFGTVPVSCLVNPRAGRELEFPASPGTRTGQGKRVAVVGAGPAGMEAARALAANGARVTLFEAADRIGGQFRMAGMVPGKADFLETIRYFEHQLRALGVGTELESRIDDPEQLGGFEHVVVSTGVKPRSIALPGIHLPSVRDYVHAFERPETLGDSVAIIGAGGIGVDLAHLLAAPARRVTLLRRNGPIGAGMGRSTRWAVVQAIREAGVRTLTGVEYRHIDERGVWIDYESELQLIEAESVVIAAGQEPNAPLTMLLADAGIPQTTIGGAFQSTGMNAVSAFEQGLRAGTAIAAGTAFYSAAKPETSPT